MVAPCSTTAGTLLLFIKPPGTAEERQHFTIEKIGLSKKIISAYTERHKKLKTNADLQFLK